MRREEMTVQKKIVIEWELWQLQNSRNTRSRDPSLSAIRHCSLCSPCNSRIQTTWWLSTAHLPRSNSWSEASRTQANALWACFRTLPHWHCTYPSEFVIRFQHLHTHTLLHSLFLFPLSCLDQLTNCVDLSLSLDCALSSLLCPWVNDTLVTLLAKKREKRWENMESRREKRREEE